MTDESRNALLITLRAAVDFVRSTEPKRALGDPYKPGPLLEALYSSFDSLTGAAPGVMYCIPDEIRDRADEIYAGQLNVSSPGEGTEFLRRKDAERRAGDEDRIFPYTMFAKKWAAGGTRYIDYKPFVYLVDGKNAFWVDDTPAAAAFLAECRAYRNTYARAGAW